ncbi:GatB/YqeY domain-containing protein, partial [Patescibacteria group bacterium]|nr:GatB/YqeY domain-containing protein [Patescibacteria group bacterium]
MSKLEQQIESDFLTAFKNKQKEVLNVLRLIKSSIKNESIAQKKSELADEDIIKVLKREAKKRQEAISAYQQGQRLELAAKEEKEL